MNGSRRTAAAWPRVSCARAARQGPCVRVHVACGMWGASQRLERAGAGRFLIGCGLRAVIRAGVVWRGGRPLRVMLFFPQQQP